MRGVRAAEAPSSAGEGSKQAAHCSGGCQWGLHVCVRCRARQPVRRCMAAAPLTQLWPRCPCSARTCECAGSRSRGNMNWMRRPASALRIALNRRPAIARAVRERRGFLSWEEGGRRAGERAWGGGGRCNRRRPLLQQAMHACCTPPQHALRTFWRQQPQEGAHVLLARRLQHRRQRGRGAGGWACSGRPAASRALI